MSMPASVREAVTVALAAILLGSCSTTGSSSTTPSTRAIAKVQGDNQSAKVGTAVAVSPTVRITGPNGGGVSGVAVTFVPANSLIPPGVALLVVNTDANGDAAPAGWVLGAVGTNTMTASADGVSGSPLTFTAMGY
jgi:hypothetical protein